MILDRFEHKALKCLHHAVYEEQKYIDRKDKARLEYWQGVVNTSLKALKDYKPNVFPYFKRCFREYSQNARNVSLSDIEDYLSLYDSPISMDSWAKMDKFERYLSAQLWGETNKMTDYCARTPNLRNIRGYFYHYGESMNSFLDLLNYDPDKHNFFDKLNHDISQDAFDRRISNIKGRCFYRDY